MTSLRTGRNLAANLMNKAEFWILNVVGGVCALTLAVNLYLAGDNERQGLKLNQEQTELNRTQQIHTTIQNLAIRIAQAGQTEPALRDLLVRQELKVNLNTNAASPKP